MNTGTIKFFNSTKGFGFITPKDGDELFFHISEIRGDEPREGDQVNYDIGSGRKGPCATNVKVIH